MDCQNHTIRLYTAQSPAVLEAIRREGHCFSTEAYIRRKYGESARVFLAAYTWLAREAVRHVPRPQGAALHYWAFADLQDVGQDGGHLLTLEVPADQCLLFDLHDWNKILNLQYLAADPGDEARFACTLAEQGVRRAGDALLTGFYPALRREIEASWQRLFRHHEALLAGQRPIASVQAALWQLRAEWIITP